MLRFKLGRKWLCWGSSLVMLVTGAHAAHAQAYGWPTPCPSLYPIRTDFPVPTKDNPPVYKDILMGYAEFSDNNVYNTEGFYTRAEFEHTLDKTGHYEWVRGSIDVKCTRRASPFGDEIVIRWMGFIGGYARRIDGASGCNDEIIDDGLGQNDCNLGDGTYGDGGEDQGNSVIENPPPEAQVTPSENQDDVPAGCQAVKILIAIAQEDNSVLYLLVDALYCES